MQPTEREKACFIVVTPFKEKQAGTGSFSGSPKAVLYVLALASFFRQEVSSRPNFSAIKPQMYPF
ncbi:MAG: hypothetical protein LBC27_08625 [Spirochaetaceae bacterium]|nr:hypothetical protein [Spirochaetaceae bacterium]